MSQTSIFNPEQTPLLFGETLIEANAGTGKTYTLCKIVQRLIVDHEIPIERILAVTFTNAAAHELKGRIRSNLQEVKDTLQPNQIKEKALLNRALGNFDDARLYTLHAFCKRLLAEFSFECGVRPDSELITDQSEMLKEVIQDFQRSFFGEASPFVSALSMTGNLSPEGLEDYFNQEEEEEEEEGFNLDEASNKCMGTLSELIKIWFHQKKDILNFLQEGARNGAYPRKLFNEIDRLMKQEKNPSIFSDSENLQPPSSTPEIVHFPDFQLIKILRKVFKDEIKPKDSSSLERPLFFSTVQNFCDQCDSLELHILKIFRKFAFENLLIVKDRSNVRTFDDLQKLVAEGLGGEQGGAFAKKVSSDYDAALVDEFQDTDPLQFDILRKLFSLDKEEHAKRIFYIGDPKQSIYKFRGADLNNYLSIKTGLESSNVFSLTTNYRTHPDLVSATNKFLTLHNLSEDGQTDESHLFLDKRISFIESKGSSENAPQKIFVRNNHDLSFSPFNIRYLPKLNKQEKQESFEQRILQDISSEIIKLLDFDKSTLIGENLLRGSDIAVLCRSNKEADKIQQMFLEFQIPSVLLADRSVFKTEEAQHFKYLMETLINPFESKMIKRVLLLPLFGLTAQKISDLSSNPTQWDHWANRFFEWSELWKKRGISYAIRNILNEEVHETQEGSKKVQEKILEEIGGERRLTNYLHLAESLYQAEQEISSFPRALYLWYVQQTESNLKKEEADSRLESDEDSVKIITIHKAKGLEFPITFIPFCWKVHQKDKSKENQQENIRLLYVALTRASSRIYFYLREPNTQFKNSALCRCLSAAPLDKIEHIKSNSSLFHFTEVLEPSPQGAYRKPIRNESLKPLFFTSEIASGNISGSFSSKVKGIEKEKDLDESTSPTLVVPHLERIGAHAFPAGTKAGNFFHEVFENIDFQSHDFEALVLRLLPLHGLNESNAELAKNIIKSTLQVSLDKHKGDSFKLAELSFHDRLEEMEFHLHARDFDFQELGNLLHQTEPGNRFAQYLLEKQSIGETSKELQYIKGFVDLTFKHSNKFYILDWKSNLLEGNQASFESSRLLDEMKHSDYLLQYHIYTLALHRYLKHCYANEYDYDSLFGGAYYLFIRGTYQNINPDDGIFFDRPSKSIIETMDYFLSPKV